MAETRINKVYALVADESKDISKQSTGLFDLFIDEAIQGDKLTKPILQKLKANDTIVVSNIQNLGKAVSEIVETLNLVAQYNINLYLVRENLSFKADTLPSIASSLLIANRLQQSLMSLRTQSSLQERKSKGLKLGRPFGANPALKLDDHKEEIKNLLMSGVSKDRIAEQYKVCRATVYNFVNRHPELLLGE